MADFRIQVRNFRVLERLDWSPRGVCLLAGANGAGKTTVLDALWFLRTLFEEGHEAAFQLIGGRYVRSMSVPESEPVVFELQAGEVTWRVRLPMGVSGLLDSFGEELLMAGQTKAHVGMHERRWTVGSETISFEDETRTCAKFLWDRRDAPWMRPLVNVLRGFHIYKIPSDFAQRSNPHEMRKKFLHWSGGNLWSVLEAWKSAPIRWQGRYEWVLAAAKRAFPGLISSIEFENGVPMLYPPDTRSAEPPLPPERAAAGLLTGLLQLTAVAGAKAGELIAFDEIENQLHPYAIRSLLRSVRERADEHDLTVVVTTHSPIVMNDFGNEPESFFVLDRSTPDVSQPVPLTKLHEPDALAQARLGSLYDQLEFAQPQGVVPRP